MNRTKLGLAAMAALAAACAASPASANYVSNGSFETGDFTSWTIAPVSTANSNSQNHVNALDFVFPNIGAPYVPEQGTDFAMLGDNYGTGAKLSQTITDTAGGLLLTYWVATDGVGNSNSFSVSWNGATIAGSTITNSTNTAYTEYSFWVHATGHDTLAFTALNSEGFWLLDNVQLNVPEPASIALLGSGLVAAAGAYRRRRRSKKA